MLHIVGWQAYNDNNKIISGEQSTHRKTLLATVWRGPIDHMCKFQGLTRRNGVDFDSEKNSGRSAGTSP